MQNNNLKGTRDLGLAAAFMALGAEYVEADREDPRNIEFRFLRKKIAKMVNTFQSDVLRDAVITTADSTNVELVWEDMPLDEWEANWVNQTLMVSASKYYDALKRLKSIIHTR